MYEGLLLLKESYLVATLILALDSPLSTAPSIPDHQMHFFAKNGRAARAPKTNTPYPV